MNRAFPAALALACVCSPAMAAAPIDLHRAFFTSVFAVGLGAAALGLLMACVFLRPVLYLVTGYAIGLMLLGLSIHPALAQEAAAKPGLVLPYGTWIAQYGPDLFMLLATWLAGLVSWAIAKFAPWAASVLTQKRIEMAAQALAQYAIKAVPDSVKDGKVTVQAGPDVVVTALQRGVNVLPGRLINAMIKGGGMASIIFRVLDLEDDANEHNVLQPAIAAAKASSDPKLAKAA